MKNKTLCLLLLPFVLACTYPLKSDPPADDAGIKLPDAGKDPGHPVNPPKVNPLPPMDAGVEASIIDAGPDAPVCETGTEYVGHCVTHMGTLCIAYYSDHKDECLKSGLPTGWFPGDCGSEEFSNFSRSNGACVDPACPSSIAWNYPLGGVPPTDVSRKGLKDTCESNGFLYIPVP